MTEALMIAVIMAFVLTGWAWGLYLYREDRDK